MTDKNSLHTGKCDICGKEGQVWLFPSFLDRNTIYRYCSDCLYQDAELYDSCVSLVFAVGWENLSPPYQDIINYSLAKNNKTLDDLFEDVACLDKSYVEWCESELGGDGSLY